MKRKILFVCGSINQTRQMHQIAAQLPEADRYFTPYYCDGILETARKIGLLEFCILGNRLGQRTLSYLSRNNLPVDIQGKRNDYDLVVTCSDLVVPANIRSKSVVLVQEGMTDPENFMYRLVRAVPFLPRWLASTSTTGLSDRYDRFCVASHGYRDLFVRKGVRPEKIAVTGIPNFDNCARFLKNSFPLKHYVLVCTSDMRETFNPENRARFIRKAVDIARGRRLVFKLHPNENAERAEREIQEHAPGALVFAIGNTEEMIANCDVLVTRYSSTVYVGLALGKECYSDFALDELRRLLPLQHGRAAQNIADVCRSLLARANPDDRVPMQNHGVRPRAKKRTERRNLLHTLFSRRAA
jgi:hypothetical protein